MTSQFSTLSFEDLIPPELISFEIPEVIDLSDGSLTSTFTISAEDDGGSGLNRMYFNLADPIETTAGPGFKYDISMHGRGRDEGTFSANRTFTVVNENGTINIRNISLYDMAGNRSEFSASELDEMGFRTSFEIVGAQGPDLIPPELISFEIPEVIDLSDGPVTSTFTISAADDGGSGLNRMYFNLADPIETTAGPGFKYDISMHGRGRDEGTFSANRTFTVVNENGTINIRNISLYDMAGNRNEFSASELDEMGFRTSFEIARDGDSDPSRLTGTPGDDWLTWSPANSGLRTVDGLAGFDMFSLGDANDGVSADLGSKTVFVDELVRAIDLESIEAITGSSYADVLRGDDGNNKLRGLGGPDVFYTDAGADTIEGGAGTDLLIAGEFSSGADDIRLSLLAGRGWSGAAENDQYTGIENVSSGWGNDHLTGDHRDNHLSGGYGNDTLEGNGGRDTLDGGHGIDVALFAYDRDKYLITQNGDQTIVDYIDSPGAFDGPNVVINTEIFRFADGDFDPFTLKGTPGDDWLAWDPADTAVRTVDGLAGFDMFSLGDANAGVSADLGGKSVFVGELGRAIDLVSIEAITGSSYADVLRGDDGNNKLRGLGGPDVFYTDIGADTIEGGAGTDWLIAGGFYENGADIRLSLLAGRGWTGGANGDQYTGIENVSSGWGNDHLTGDHRDNHLSGGYGNDTLEGNGGRDTLDGGHGIDVALFAYDRDKYLITQNGHQTIVDYIDRPGDFDGPNVVINTEILRFADGDFDPFTLRGTPGNDWLAWNPADTTLRTVDGLAGFDMLSFGDANGGVSADLDDQIVFVSELGREIVLESIEGITGSSFADELRGDEGNNKLRGLGGPDEFFTDVGADTIQGGDGTDLLVAGEFAAGAADIHLSLLAGRGWSGDALADQYIGIENVSSGWGDDSLTGDHGDNHLNGGYGDDFLIGAGGDDTLDGGHGTDIVLFSGFRRDYTVTNDGFRTTVDYTGPGADDGTNIVIHSEILRFADGDLIL